MTCTVTKNLEIVPGTRADYETLSQYHYRQTRVGPYAAIYSLKGRFSSAEADFTAETAEDAEKKYNKKSISAVSACSAVSSMTAGVIVYAMPTAGCSMRSVAMPFLAGLDRHTRLNLLNKNVRTISRVIIEPRFRSLGLAVRLVRETMPLMNVRFVEALAVMGQVNPFFEKAGMTRYDAPPSPACARLLEAFDAVGIGQQDLLDPQLVQEKMDSRLRGNDKREFIESEMVRFLQSYGRRRLMKPGIERTQFILSKLTDRPVYYLWQNQSNGMRI